VVLQDASRREVARTRPTSPMATRNERSSGSPRPDAGILERLHVVTQGVIHRQRVQIGAMAHRSNEVSRSRRALSPMASPRCAAGTHWLTNHGASGNARYAGRAILAQLFELFPPRRTDCQKSNCHPGRGRAR